MNQRINAIIEQVGMTLKERQPYDEENYPGYGCSDNDHFHDNLSAVRAFFDGGLEKFAELIVQECASICELNSESYKYSFTPAKARVAESTSKHCGLFIKKHFGVE